MVDYRGYGKSDGVPTEEGLQLDALATLRAAVVIAGPDPIFIMGTSLGGAVAIDLCCKPSTKQYVAGVIVENTFTGISDMVGILFQKMFAARVGPTFQCFFIKFVKPIVLWIDWHNMTKVPKITAPMLFLSSAKDELIPPEHMANLYAAATSSTSKQFVSFPDAGHNDTYQRDGYFEHIARFMEISGRAHRKVVEC